MTAFLAGAERRSRGSGASPSDISPLSSSGDAFGLVNSRAPHEGGNERATSLLLLAARSSANVLLPLKIRIGTVTAKAATMANMLQFIFASITFSALTFVLRFGSRHCQCFRQYCLLN